MAIYLPSTAEEEQLALDELTPREIVVELDKYVIGQKDAKRAVAIALRNRTRRQKLPPDLAEEIIPKNIIMIGPTGVGKTEIARRLAKLANSPFLKVEAWKFPEGGDGGRDGARSGGDCDRQCSGRKIGRRRGQGRVECGGAIAGHPAAAVAAASARSIGKSGRGGECR